MKNTWIIFILSYNLAVGQVKMETDRPDQTECSSVIPVKVIQVETGGIYTNTYSTHKFNYPTTLIRFGLLSSMEIRLIAGEFQSEKSYVKNLGEEKNGFEPVEVGTKISVCDEKRLRPQIAFLGHLSVTPSENDNIQKLIVMPNFRFSLAHTLSDVFSLGYNLGMEWEVENKYPVYVYTLTTGAQLNKKLYSFIEVFGNSSSGIYPECSFNGGFAYQPLVNLQFDFAGGVGLNAFSDQFFLSVGLSFRLPH